MKAMRKYAVGPSDPNAGFEMGVVNPSYDSDSLASVHQRQPSASSSGSSKPPPQKPPEVIFVQTKPDMTYENVEPGYYEDVIFNRVPNGEAVVDDMSDYEEVIVNGTPTSTSNYENVKPPVEAETMFSVARRFPSIKVKKNKKGVEELYSVSTKRKQHDSKVLADEAGSHPRAAIAIFKTVASKSKEASPANSPWKRRLSEAKEKIWHTKVPVPAYGNSSPNNISHPSRCSKLCQRPRKLSSVLLCAVIVFSVIAFIVAGAVLMYQSLSGGVITVTPASHGRTQPHSTTSRSDWPKPRLPRPLRPDDFRGALTSWSLWSEWSKCSAECLQGESQARSRTCLDVNNSSLEDIKPCIQQGGLNVDIRLCLCNSRRTRAVMESPSGVNTSGASDVIRYCDRCTSDEVCLAMDAEPVPRCRAKMDDLDPTGCGGWCRPDVELCDRLDNDAYRCEGLRRYSPCPTGFFSCPLSGSPTGSPISAGSSTGSSDPVCLSPELICDGVPQCPWGEDESHCPPQAMRLRRGKAVIRIKGPVCTANEFACASGLKCIPKEYFCDNYFDCDDRSDEPKGCSSQQCNSNEVKCRNGRCSPHEVLCGN